jgi:hypothetical protein
MCDYDNAEWQRYEREQASAYLKRVRDARRHIAAINAEVDEVRNLASGLKGIDYSRDVVTTSPTDDAMPNAVSKLLDLIAERVALVDSYVRMMDECDRALKEMGGLHERILRYRYINDAAWADVEKAIGYSGQWLHELHKRALADFYDYMPTRERNPLPPAL